MRTARFVPLRVDGVAFEVLAPNARSVRPRQQPGAQAQFVPIANYRSCVLPRSILVGAATPFRASFSLHRIWRKVIRADLPAWLLLSRVHRFGPCVPTKKPRAL